MIRRAGDDGEMRALAELEHKPWAADDGDVWLAAFSVDVALADGADIELSVAPDIAVALARRDAGPARPGDVLPAARPSRSPVAKSAAEQKRRRPARAGAQEVERLAGRLAAATQQLELERQRRGASDRALEDERATTRRLRTELGQAQAELEIARAADAEAAAAAEDLERARRELIEAQRRHEELVRQRDLERNEARSRHEEIERQRDETTEAHAAVRTALHERSGALESARAALAQERTELGRLRSRLANAEQSRGDAAPPGPPGSDSPGDARRTGRPLPDVPPRMAPGTTRPLNPSLRHTYWLGRALALLVLLVVVVAVWIVLQSTILH